MQISSDSSESDQEFQFKRIYQRQLQKKQKDDQLKKKQRHHDKDRVKQQNHQNHHRDPQRSRRNRSSSLSGERSRSRQRSREKKQQKRKIETPQEIKWHIYDSCPKLSLQSRISPTIIQLPIFKKKDDIINAIIKNQFVLITGQTGCGKSTQVPRLIYEYMRGINDTTSKIMCVQPRRLAVINLHSILQQQMAEKKCIGYQIGMKSLINPTNRIVFVTNGIFLQRLVHSTEFFNEYPFIVLDEVHERDIDTDFILLTIKRVIRQHPKVRIILMSATIDNDLFRYYFASDHIDNILTEENFYKKIIMSKQIKKQNQSINYQLDQEDVEIQSDKEDLLYKNHEFQFMKSRFPCPTINVTQPGKYKRQFFYLDTLKRFLPEGALNIKWGSIIFSDKYANTHKQLYETVSLIIDHIAHIHRKQSRKCSVLIFMPGLAEIENLSQNISRYFKSDRIRKEFELIHVHSTILNDQISNKLHEKEGDRIKIIISTNIAESSITVLGVKYVIDFCLSKEVRFDLKSRMENLELVWASKASCSQRAGRTGRVCDGVIFRLLQEDFYNKLPDYSTPEIQRSSLDKLILRIKLLHQGNQNDIFSDPGQVLGSAIQPPNLKNIDTALKSLQFCGGLEFKEDQFYLTDLGRLYIDIPIDITYCKLLVMSQLFETYEDILILVSILSQSKNAIRKGNIQKNYIKFFETMDNKESCDFTALINLYKDTEKRYGNSQYAHKSDMKRNRFSNNDNITLEIYSQVRQMIRDIQKRIGKKDIFINRKRNQENQKNFVREYDFLCEKMFGSNGQQQKRFRFQLTIMYGFIQNILKIREPSFDQKQEKRIRNMKKTGINTKNTVCLLGSTVIKRPETEEAMEKLVNVWRSHVQRAVKIKDTNLTVTYGLSYLHFNNSKDLQKFLFYKHIQESSKKFSDNRPAPQTEKNYLTIPQILNCFGETDHMHCGRPVTFSRQQTVAIDNFSLNRVININEQDNTKYLVANNIAKQSSRMIARYTSLLPTNIKHLEIIGHLLFYPFVSLVTNKNKSRYESIQLNKKYKVPITYNLTQQEIEKANIIRSKIRSFLTLKQNPGQILENFKYLILEFVFLYRQQVIEQERWQQSYLQQVFQYKPDLKVAYEELLKNKQNAINNAMDIQPAVNLDKVFMNNIKSISLNSNYFSSIMIADTTLEWRKKSYDDWKKQKLKQILEIEEKAMDNDSYLACGQNSCGLKIAKLKKVGPVSQQIFRDLFEIVEQNLKQMEFNQMDCHFCSLLMHHHIDSQYKIYGCKNDHYVGIMLSGQKRIKILAYSQLMNIYPDGTAEMADFGLLDMNKWKYKHDNGLKQKFKMKISTYCFACDQLLTSLKDLQTHIKQERHIGNVTEFKRTIPDLNTNKMNKQQQSGY